MQHRRYLLIVIGASKMLVNLSEAEPLPYKCLHSLLCCFLKIFFVMLGFYCISVWSYSCFILLLAPSIVKFLL